MPTSPAAPGSISSGTHRAEDLIPAFARALRASTPTNPAHVALLNQSLHADSLNDMGRIKLAHALMDALESYAPEGHYFGAHPGDGADFGFWPLEHEEV